MCDRSVPRDAMGGIFAPTRWNLLGLPTVGLLLAIIAILISSPVIQYGLGLVVFSIWMAWFVLAGVWFLSNVEF
ncbi:MAG: hypothetical protein SVG88_07350 [Halobacteriales archaeon]|nr:hypothetical protein [Halobacteriales archaeon]